MPSGLFEQRDLVCVMPCPFCELDPSRIVWSSPLVLAIRDGFPVSRGHTLVVPRRHVPTWFDASPEEQRDIWRAVSELKEALDQRLGPDGYNIGINSGEAAGQTVMHLHVHLIPRFAGDVDDPRGGVRFVIPSLGNYKAPGTIPKLTRGDVSWLPERPAAQRLVKGGLQDPFVLHLRPALRRAQRADIVAAFVQGSGVELLASAITTALERGTAFRVLTGNYLHITQSQALRRLLDWMQVARSSEQASRGSFEVRIVETESLGGRSFHPKSWRVETSTLGIAWVGSSNWSRMALSGGVEWNLRVDRAADPGGYAEVVQAFENLWAGATELTSTWLEGYTDRASEWDQPLVLGDNEDLEPATLFEPIGVQPDALAALAESRDQGRTRALIVLATGLGKTFLAAFDVRAMADDLGRMPKVLFIAHRRELLLQAASTFRKVFPQASLGLFVGNSAVLDADLVFASIQKLTQPSCLSALAPDQFDYVIVDESHHAPAQSYRRVLAQLAPHFLLGLTATPDRADQADVAGLFDDHVAYRADLGEGIDIGRLVPFDYLGLPDTIEFEPIPWRKYTIDQLAQLAETQARMERLWTEWQKYPGTRTLVFCVSIRHANYVSDWLAARGVAIVAVHTGDGSADRNTALEKLERGELDAVAAVDLFNEGIDLPLIDRVVMLRPTGSPVVFLQQLGRGLRVAEGKERLQVIDFIGNHRVFLGKVRTLLSLSKNKTSLSDFVRSNNGVIELAKGCRVNVDLKVLQMLRKFLPSGAKNETIRMYRELRDAREERPTPGELVRMSMNPRSLKAESWFAFVEDEGDLSSHERSAFEHAREWFRQVEVTAMSKSFKMITLNVMIEANALFTGMSLHELAAQAHAALSRDPSLRQDIKDVSAFEAGSDSSAWRAYWRKNPVQSWLKGRWFGLDDGRMVFAVAAPELAAQPAFLDLTRELVDMRLATYRRRNRPAADGVSTFVCKVFHNKRHPILKLPNKGRDKLPVGETDVRMDDGRVWQFRFMKIACNVARPVGSKTNALPDLLYRWFGPAAGKPGTSFHVRFRRSPEGWWAEPYGVVIELPPLGSLVSFPSLRAAAGSAGDAQTLVEADTVRLPVHGEGRFAVRASGDSMNGGKRPIYDGDWVVLEWARGLGLHAVSGRVCLVARGDVDVGHTHHLKRVVRDEAGVSLRSDNPVVPDLRVSSDTIVIARMVDVVRPESLGPVVGTVMDDVAEAFGLSQPPPPGVSRVDGHLFLLVDKAESLDAPDRLAWRVEDLAPSETAYVFTAFGSGWRFAGVGRWTEERWEFPPVDFDTWRKFGRGRSASRRLSSVWIRVAEQLVAFVDGQHVHGDWMEGLTRRCRFQGRSAKGGVRIDHETMKERTISLNDLGWVLQAFDRRTDNGGVLDEAWVNYLRYLDGTPKASTRWIDTRWALVLLDHVRQLGFVGTSGV